QMGRGLSRREFIKLGTVGGITLMFARLPAAQAVQVHSGAHSKNWLNTDGSPRYRWDALRKVTGEKVFAYDYRARDLPGWPEQQAHVFFIKATQADRRFEGVDLSLLGSHLQPDRLVLHEDLERDGIHAPNPPDLGPDFYGRHLLTPKGETPSMLGHPVAMLVYEDFERFQV